MKPAPERSCCASGATQVRNRFHAGARSCPEEAPDRRRFSSCTISRRAHSSHRFNPGQRPRRVQSFQLPPTQPPTLLGREIVREINRLRSMANLFLKQAKQYVATRPVYPPELFDFIASKTPRRNMAWDVGTGSGQAPASVSRSSSLSPSPLPSPHARLLPAISCQ